MDFQLSEEQNLVRESAISMVELDIQPILNANFLKAFSSFFFNIKK